jgi:hypothetical protein
LSFGSAPFELANPSCVGPEYMLNS